jgi:MFS family permease
LAIGGVLVSAFDWRWIFFLNVLIGAICVSGLALLPHATRVNWKRFDMRGAVTSISILLAVAYLVESDSQATRRSTWLVVVATAAGLLLVPFVCCKSDVRFTIIRRRIARTRRIAALNAVAAMLSIAALTWTFTCTLYLQRVLAFNPMQVGLLFLPAAAGSAGASLSVAPRLVARFGVRLAAVMGLLSVGTGLALLWQIPNNARFLYDILPGMLLVGTGTGMSYTPLVHAALRGTAPDHVGAASALINTSYMVGGAIGLSVLGGIASGHTEELIAAGVNGRIALGGGYRVAFGLSAAVAFIAAIFGAAVLRDD